MDMIQEKTYESIYYQLWELSQRYKTFTQFRVIGKSHDDRMIPMLEIGTGDTCIFCVAGFSGVDWMMSDRLTEVTMELCRNYECGVCVQCKRNESGFKFSNQFQQQKKDSSAAGK